VSLFGTIMSKIFGRGEAAEAGTAGAPPATGAAAGQAGTQAGVAPQSGATPSAATAGPGAPATAVDVEAVLTDLAAKNPQQLNWRQSIVDLMKLLGLDSSLENRKELARELNYTGDSNDSASMNVWLHKQVMRKLAENGGTVPADLRD